MLSFSKIKKAVKLTLHAGNKYSCVFCGYKSRDLSPIGLNLKVLKEKQVIGAGLRNAACYKCGSTDRERLIYLYLTDKLKIADSKSLHILHLAPEKNIADRFSQLGFSKYVCGDLFTPGYTYPEYVQNMNVLDIPFPDNSFDLIICNHLLEHVPNDKDAMKELYRVLKSGGKAVLQVPISKNSAETFEDFTVTTPHDREIVFGQFDHVRIYGQDYTERLKSVGFRVERTNISAEYPNRGLCKDEDIFIAHK